MRSVLKGTTLKQPLFVWNWRVGRSRAPSVFPFRRGGKREQDGNADVDRLLLTAERSKALEIANDVADGDKFCKALVGNDDPLLFLQRHEELENIDGIRAEISLNGRVDRDHGRVLF